jgi:hypothetical protein
MERHVWTAPVAQAVLKDYGAGRASSEAAPPNFAVLDHRFEPAVSSEIVEGSQ